MQFHPNELFLVVNPETTTGKKTKAIAKTICSHVNEVDVLHEHLGPTYWKELITMLGIEPKELLDRSQSDYQDKVAGKALTMTGWLDVLTHYPHLICTPIAVFNGRAIMCNTPTDLFKLGIPSQSSGKE